MLPYSRQHIDKKDIQEVAKTLASDWLTQGPKVREFEEALAKYCGAKYAVVCPNGTAALHLAYMAAGLGRGDEIITPANTFAATTNMAIVCGAKPVFCDIRLDTYNIDESQVEKLITSRTKVIAPVHFAGHPCEMDEIMRIARNHNLLVIEDACHALGALYKDRKIGSIGDMTVFSFHPVKSITTGEGGAILTNNEGWYKKMLSLRTHGMVHNPEKKKEIGPWFHEMEYLSFNYRITDIQCALGVSQLKKIERFRAKQEKVAKYYFEKLSKVPGVILPAYPPHVRHGWHLFVIRVADPAKRKHVFEYLQQKGVGVQVHYIPVYQHPYYRRVGYAKINLPKTEEYYATCMSIPIYTGLSKKDQNYVIRSIKEAVA